MRHRAGHRHRAPHRCPGASWITWEEPSTTGPGQAIAYTPELGQHQAQCNPAGTMLISRTDFEALRGQHAGEALIAAIDEALGGPWARDYAARGPIPEGCELG